MTGDSGHVPIGALVQSRIGSQLHKFLLSDNGGSMWCSTLTTITSHNRRNISEFEDEWRINNLPGRPTIDQSDCFSNFSYTNWREVTKFENTEQPGQTDHFD